MRRSNGNAPKLFAAMSEHEQNYEVIDTADVVARGCKCLVACKQHADFTTAAHTTYSRTCCCSNSAASPAPETMLPALSSEQHMSQTAACDAVGKIVAEAWRKNKNVQDVAARCGVATLAVAACVK